MFGKTGHYQVPLHILNSEKPLPSNSVKQQAPGQKRDPHLFESYVRMLDDWWPVTRPVCVGLTTDFVDEGTSGLPNIPSCIAPTKQLTLRPHMGKNVVLGTQVRWNSKPQRRHNSRQSFDHCGALQRNGNSNSNNDDDDNNTSRAPL